MAIFLGFCVLVAFYRAGHINEHLENELWVIQLISAIRKIDIIKVISYKVYCPKNQQVNSVLHAANEKVKSNAFFLLLSNTLKTKWLSSSGCYKLSETSTIWFKWTQYNTVKNNVMNGPCWHQWRLEHAYCVQGIISRKHATGTS